MSEESLESKRLDEESINQINSIDIDKIENSEILGLQNTLDIHSFLNEGLSKEGVLKLMIFRAELINLLSESLSLEATPSIDDIITLLLDQMIKDHELTSSEMIPLNDESIVELRNPEYSSTEDVNWVIDKLMTGHMEHDLISDEVLPTQWGLAYQSLYKRFSPPISPLLLARELMTQILDLSNGNGVWVKS